MTPQPSYSEGFRVALKRVGQTPEAVAAILGSCVDGESVHLVGSLAAGLGNPESDVDLHVFMNEDLAGVVPMLFFAGRTRLDVVHLSTRAPAAALAETPDRWARLAGGRCALGELAEPKALKRLSRWITAIPVHDGAAPIFPSGDRERIGAALARHAVDVAVRSAALARVMHAARSRFARLAWSRAGEAAIEARTRLAGELFIGDKWLAAKAVRAGLGPELLAEARTVATAGAFDRLVRKLGLPIDRPARLVRVARNEGRPFRFGERAYELVGARLVPASDPSSTSLEGAIAEIGGAAVRAGLVAGSLELHADGDAVDRRLACA